MHVGTHEHYTFSSSLTTYLCPARLIVNITHQHDNEIKLQVIHCYACYSVGSPDFQDEQLVQNFAT